MDEVSPVLAPEITGVLAPARTIVKSSMRKVTSNPSGPERLRFAMPPVTVTIGRSSVGGGGAGGGGSGAGGGGAGSAIGGPGCVGEVGVSLSSLHAVMGSADAITMASKTDFIDETCIALISFEEIGCKALASPLRPR